jgi:N-acetylglucosaminyl-diphospho-decaprenol L-rhamnosyltransferase
MDLSIICVNWNSVDYLRECIASIHEHTQGLEFEIIVVDNASPQRDVDILKEEFPDIRILKSQENIGFAKANNCGFRHSTGEYVMFLNPDTKLMERSINIMVEAIKSLPDAGIVGCKLLNADLSVQLSSIQKFPTILNQALDAEYLQLRWPHCPLWEIAPLFSDEAKLQRVEVISGACMLLRRSVFDRVGMFSEDYFMYAEDLDLNFKVKRAGFTNYYVGGTKIIHYGGKSSSRQQVSQWSTILKHRAMRRLFRKMRGRPYEWMYRAAMGCVALGRLSILAVMFPFGDRESLRHSADKWKTILRCAIGVQDLAIEDR